MVDSISLMNNCFVPNYNNLFYGESSPSYQNQESLFSQQLLALVMYASQQLSQNYNQGYQNPYGMDNSFINPRPDGLMEADGHPKPFGMPNPYYNRQNYLPASPSIQYMKTTADGKQLDLQSGLDYSKNSLLSLDKKTYTIDENWNLISTNEKDNKISVAEAGPMGSILDLDGSGFISSGENLSLAKLQDISNPNKMADGMVTYEETDKANQMFAADPANFKAELTRLYNEVDASGASIASKEKALKDAGTDIDLLKPKQ